METVEVVIKLKKERYDELQKNKHLPNRLDIEKAITDGTVLPQGHGRLIDADAINIHDVSPAYGMEVYGVTQDDIEYEPTIIEADKDGETDESDAEFMCKVMSKTVNKSTDDRNFIGGF